MKQSRIALALVPLLFSGACAAPPEAVDPGDDDSALIHANLDYGAKLAPEGDEGDLTRSSASELNSAGVACRAACWTIAGAGCAAVGVSCSGATVLTVGGVSIPCTVAIITACAAVGGGASVCSDWCTVRFRG